MLKYLVIFLFVRKMFQAGNGHLRLKFIPLGGAQVKIGFIITRGRFASLTSLSSFRSRFQKMHLYYNFDCLSVK